MNNLEQEYNNALTFAKSHYENFPVVSVFIPKNLQKHVAIIYKFARTADDFADEPKYNDNDRLKLLNDFEEDLTKALDGNFKDTFWEALINTINNCDLDKNLFFDLLKAFKLDVIKNEFNDLDELLQYCKFSANPIGRLILQLHGIKNEEAYKYSDNICTALQLTNFWQDVSVDLLKNRVYIPLKDLKRFDYTIQDLKSKNFSNNLINLLKYEVEITEAMFFEGKKLLKFLPGKLKIQIKLTILGGLKILDKIKKNNYNVIYKRYTIDKKDVITLLLKSFLWKN